MLVTVTESIDAFNNGSVVAGFTNERDVIFNMRLSAPLDPPMLLPSNVTVLLPPSTT